jgi:glutamate---cysteine ligase / carboxylate-amine ligase
MFPVGVEEEFLLFDPAGTVAPVASDVVCLSGAGQQIKPEFMAYQLETSTRPVRRLDQLRSQLIRLRRLAGSSAEQLGVRLLSVGLPPFRAGPSLRVRPDLRYAELVRRFPAATWAGGACACQVHIGIPDRELRVQVLARIRPWLATLLTLTANSPIFGGLDTGWHSYRYRALLHWPTFRPPAAWSCSERYDQAIGSLIASGAAPDRAGVFLLARLSARYPTIEVRVADAALTAEDTVLLAAVVRALATVLAEDARRGRPVMPASHARVKADLMNAARSGAWAPDVRRHDKEIPAVNGRHSRLLSKIWPALEESGDVGEVTGGLIRLNRYGTGADRQRAMWSRAKSPADFVALLADAAVEVAAA